MESVYTHFQHIQPWRVCSAPWVQPTITIPFLTWRAVLQETASWTTSGFLKETSVTKGQFFWHRKKSTFLLLTQQNLRKNFHWHRKWVLWWIEWILKEIQDHLKYAPFFIMLIISQPHPSCLFLQKNVFEPKSSYHFLLGEQWGKWATLFRYQKASLQESSHLPQWQNKGFRKIKQIVPCNSPFFSPQTNVERFTVPFHYCS